MVACKRQHNPISKMESISPFSHRFLYSCTRGTVTCEAFSITTLILSNWSGGDRTAYPFPPSVWLCSFEAGNQDWEERQEEEINRKFRHPHFGMKEVVQAS